LRGRSLGVFGDTQPEGVDFVGAPTGPRKQTFDTWHVSLSLGYSLTLFSVVSFGFGISTGYDVVQEERLPNPFKDETAQARIGIGSVFGVADRQIPLLSVHLSSWASLDGHVALDWFAEGRFEETYLLGTTFTW
jgi:hypothetical protein